MKPELGSDSVLKIGGNEILSHSSLCTPLLLRMLGGTIQTPEQRTSSSEYYRLCTRVPSAEESRLTRWHARCHRQRPPGPREYEIKAQAAQPAQDNPSFRAECRASWAPWRTLPLPASFLSHFLPFPALSCHRHWSPGKSLTNLLYSNLLFRGGFSKIQPVPNPALFWRLKWPGSIQGVQSSRCFSKWFRYFDIGMGAVVSMSCTNGSAYTPHPGRPAVVPFHSSWSSLNPTRHSHCLHSGWTTPWLQSTFCLLCSWTRATELGWKKHKVKLTVLEKQQNCSKLFEYWNFSYIFWSITYNHTASLILTLILLLLLCVCEGESTGFKSSGKEYWWLRSIITSRGKKKHAHGPVTPSRQWPCLISVGPLRPYLFPHNAAGSLKHLLSAYVNVLLFCTWWSANHLIFWPGELFIWVWILPMKESAEQWGVYVKIIQP